MEREEHSQVTHDVAEGLQRKLEGKMYAQFISPPLTYLRSV